MLSLSPRAHSALPSGRGFAWWYADLVAPNGDGAVLIWSVGLPFFPWTSDDGTGALDRGALAISVYREGREQFYLLSAARPGDVEWAPREGRFRVGESSFRIERSATRVSLRGDIDGVIPGGGRVRGQLQLDGRPCGFATLGDGEDRHDWAPATTACSGRLDLEGTAGEAVRVAGRAYLDANRSEAPLSELGIEEWRWARLALPDRELVHYELCGPRHARKSFVLEVDPDGSTRRLDDVVVTPTWGAPGPFGLRKTRAIELAHAGSALARVEFDALVDDGPFYQRYLVSAETDCGGGHGFAERVLPDRLDLRWMAPLVAMRAHRCGTRGSRFLPLFSGAREDRWSRLLRGLLLPGAA